MKFDEKGMMKIFEFTILFRTTSARVKPKSGYSHAFPSSTGKKKVHEDERSANLRCAPRDGSTSESRTTRTILCAD